MTDVSAAPAVDPERSLGDLVAELPARARVFEAAGIDYCCHGRRSLAAACRAAGLDVAAVAADLATVADRSGADIDGLGPIELIDHLEATHHAYLRDELPALDALAAKVAGVHGERHPELAEVARLVTAVRADLEPHLDDEEQVVFPAIRRAVTGDAGSASVERELDALRSEHELVGELLGELRTVSAGYAVPADGCASYTSLYTRLGALETDTFRHIHLENNVLFPAVDEALGR